MTWVRCSDANGPRSASSVQTVTHIHPTWVCQLKPVEVHLIYFKIFHSSGRSAGITVPADLNEAHPNCIAIRF